jgi:protoporphyrinogen oxidase
MAEVVILGAGLAGISTAYHLEQNGYTDYAMFEQEADIGGLCGSVQQEGFTFDYTGHLLHINDRYFNDLIEREIGFEHFNVINRRSFIYSQERYTAYPYQMNLHGLPTKTIAACIEGYIKRRTDIKKPKNFNEWVLKHFGSGFAKYFFTPYQEKIFACSVNEITASWTGRFVPHTTLQDIIAGALKPHEEKIGYNAQFFYPKKGGILFWVQKLAKTLTNTVHTHCKAIAIDPIQKCIIFSNGHVETYKTLINTAPLDIFLRMLKGPDKSILSNAANNLRCNSVINFNLGIKRPNLSDKHWIYFPEKEFPFYRIGFGHNFSEHMAPSGCSSLYGEFSHTGHSETYVQKTLDLAVRKTKEVLNITDSDIITQKIIPISHAYVIYDHWREKNLPKIIRALEEKGIYSIGRYGAWKYCSMQETVLDGKEAAEKVLNKAHK